MGSNPNLDPPVMFRWGSPLYFGPGGRGDSVFYLIVPNGKVYNKKNGRAQKSGRRGTGGHFICLNDTTRINPCATRTNSCGTDRRQFLSLVPKELLHHKNDSCATGMHACASRIGFVPHELLLVPQELIIAQRELILVAPVFILAVQDLILMANRSIIVANKIRVRSLLRHKS